MFLINKCEQCHKLSFYPRIRTLHFPFLPKVENPKSEKNVCRKCARGVDYLIRYTHKQLRPPILFVIKFYILKAYYHPRLLLEQIKNAIIKVYDKFRTKNSQR